MRSAPTVRGPCARLAPAAAVVAPTTSPSTTVIDVASTRADLSTGPAAPSRTRHVEDGRALHRVLGDREQRVVGVFERVSGGRGPDPVLGREGHELLGVTAGEVRDRAQ